MYAEVVMYIKTIHDSFVCAENLLFCSWSLFYMCKTLSKGNIVRMRVIMAGTSLRMRRGKFLKLHAPLNNACIRYCCTHVYTNL